MRLEISNECALSLFAMLHHATMMATSTGNGTLCPYDDYELRIVRNQLYDMLLERLSSNDEENNEDLSSQDEVSDEYEKFNAWYNTQKRILDEMGSDDESILQEDDDVGND